MRLVIGLGNPGGQYLNTRHNAGFLVADALKGLKSTNQTASLRGQIYKSTNFMNESGSFVKKLVDQYKLDLSNLYIIHDDLDIPLGSYKIQLGHSPKDHNGVGSVDESLGTSEYWHVKIGIDNRPLDGRPMGEEYVLQNFLGEEKKILNGVIEKVCKEMVHLQK